MHRLDRRIRILRGKRNGAFDPNQYYLEKAARARVARKVRFHLRRMDPVVLITPRWSEARGFLDDVSVDLALGKPQIEARTLSMAPIVGRSVHESRTWLVRAITEFVGFGVDGPVSQAVDRRGFRYVVGDLLAKARTGPRRALLIHHLEHLHVEALGDFVQVFEEYMGADDRRLNVLFAGSVDVPAFEMPGAVRVHLGDFSDTEAVEHLAEHTGAVDRKLLARAVDLVGGVPALLERLGDVAEKRGGRLPETREELFRALGPLADELRGALEIVLGDVKLAARFEHIAQGGAVAYDPDRDVALVRAGVVEHRPSGSIARVAVRAPVFGDVS